jgi:membrane-bound serine protease (ClpP class)
MMNHTTILDQGTREHMMMKYWLLQIRTVTNIPLLLAVLLLLLGTSLVQAQERSVLVLEATGPVTPVMANFLARGIAEAEQGEYEALLVILDTPGGQIDVTLTIVSSFLDASVPVIVYVGPRGAQAASAGSVITMAAHASGMAPNTVIGAASPVGIEGGDLGETAFRKITEDLKALVRSLTEERGEEAVTLAEAMIEEARAVNGPEALAAGLVDAVAVSADDLLIQLDGKTVQVQDTAVTLNTANARQQPLTMSAIEQLLGLLTNPVLVSILFVIGVQGILIELSNPGGYVPGIVGLLCLGLALYGVGQLPVNWLGMGLIILAFSLFIAEVFTPTYGLLGITGAISLLAGLLVLFNSPGTPEFARIPVVWAVVISGGTAGGFLFIMSKAVSAQFRPPTTGSEVLVGARGPVRRPFAAANNKPPYRGMVLVYGELWQAIADEPLERDTRVVVTKVEGFTLHVMPLDKGEKDEV